MVIFFFLESIFLMIFFSFVSTLKLVFFAPFLSILYFKKDFIKSLYYSFSVGIILDLFSSSIMGLNALCYTLTTFFLYKQKKFFKQNTLSIFMFTIVISITYSILYFIFSFVLERRVLPFSFLSDLFLMPFLDGVYAFLFFIFPMKIFEKTKGLNILPKIFKK